MVMDLRGGGGGREEAFSGGDENGTRLANPLGDILSYLQLKQMLIERYHSLQIMTHNQGLARNPSLTKKPCKE